MDAIDLFRQQHVRGKKDGTTELTGRWCDRCWYLVGSGCLVCTPTRRLVKAPGWL